jgi:hypothetical protein
MSSKTQKDPGVNGVPVAEAAEPTSTTDAQRVQNRLPLPADDHAEAHEGEGQGPRESANPLTAYSRATATAPVGIPDPTKQLEAYKSRAAHIEAVKKPPPRVTSLQVRKPIDQEYIRVKPATEHLFPLFKKKDSNTLYMFVEAVEPYLNPRHIRQYRLVLAKSLRAVTPFIWAMPIPLDDMGYSWHASALAISQEAETGWVQVVSDMEGSCYVSYPPEHDLEEPEWPTESFDELLWLAFKNHRIDGPEHKVIRELKGRKP